MVTNVAHGEMQPWQCVEDCEKLDYEEEQMLASDVGRNSVDEYFVVDNKIIH